MSRALLSRTGRIRGAVLALVALVAAACGGGPAVPQVEGLSDVAAAVEEAGSVRFEMRIDMKMFGQEFALTGEGVTDTATGHGRFTMRGEGVAAPFGENEIVTLGDTLYVRGALAQQYAPGTTVPPGSWLAVDASAMAAMSQQGFTTVEQLMDAMRAAGGSVEELGEQEIRGAPAQGFRGTTTVRGLYEQAGISPDEAFDAMSQMQPTPPGTDEATVRAGFDASLDVVVVTTAWVGEDGLPRRMVMEMDMGEAMAAFVPEGETVELVTVMTMDVLEYGVEVDVEAPSPDQVVRAA